MEVLSSLLHGFSVALTPINLMFAVIGCLAGTLIGALPGIGPVSGVALLLPLTFGMNPTTAIIMLAAIYYGAMYGGTITSVLINTPGDSASVVTTLDGYQMALKGRAGVALGLSALGSFIAGTFGVVMIMLLSPPLAKLALKFGPPEYFAFMIVALTALSSLSENAGKGWTMLLLGLGLAVIGLDEVSGAPRYTFGIPDLFEGIDFLPVAIGLFGMAEVLTSKEGDGKVLQQALRLRDVWPSMKDWVDSRWSIVRGSVLGFFVGVLPGGGATIASFLSYGVEKRLAKNPAEFGKGAVQGVAGPEAANNAASAGAMIPLLALGVPGSGTATVLLGGFMLWGLRPGPMLFTQQPDFVWGLIASMYIGNVLLVIMNTAMIPLFVKALRVPNTILVPLVMMICIVGAYAQRNNMFDVWLALGFGVLGYVLNALDYPPTPLVLGLVLGPLMENTMRQSLMMSQGSLTIFFNRPITAALMLLAALMAVVPPVLKYARGRKERGETSAA